MSLVKIEQKWEVYSNRVVAQLKNLKKRGPFLATTQKRKLQYNTNWHKGITQKANEGILVKRRDKY